MSENGHGHTHSELRLHLLGGFRVERGGQILPGSIWHRRAASTLVKLLAIAPARRLHREQLIEILWPEVDPNTALDHLHKAVSAARHALEPDLPPKGKSSYLRLTDEVVSLATDGLWVDAWHFERLARGALASNDPAAYDAALAAYAGELLPEDRYESWATEQRDALADLSLHLLLRLAHLHERQGADGRAIECLHRALQHDPTREDAHRELMRLYARRGSRHQALRQYQACVQALARELEVEPGPETQTLYEEIASGRLSPAGGRRPVPAAVRRRPATPLIGRERALAALREDMARAATGEGGTTLISGEAGIGKSRLMAEIAREGLDGRWTVLWGASHEEEGVLPYGAWIEAVEPFLRTQPAGERDRLAAAYPELGRLVPSLRRGQPDVRPGNSDLERTQLFAAVVGFMADLAAARPLLLICDDLHAADPATVQLLHHLAQSAPERPWLMLGAYREEDVPREGALRWAVLGLTRAGLCRHLELLRLSQPELDRFTRTLLGGGRVDSRLVERLFALSLGNPLFAQELVGAAREAGRLAQVDGRWREVGGGDPPVPRGVRDLVGARVDRMGAQVQDTLALAATAGLTVSFRLLADAAGIAFGSALREAVLLDALDRALDARILAESEGGYSFPHPLLRAALYDRLSAARRQYLHASLAQSMERDTPNEVEALAYHYRRGGDRDRALIYLERAGEHASAVYAHDVAERYYREVLDLLPESGRRLDEASLRNGEARLRLRLGEVLSRQARYDDALQELDRSARLYQAGEEHTGLAATTAQIGQVHFLRGTAEEGLSRVRPLLDQVESDADSQVPPDALSAVYVGMAQLCLATGRSTNALAAAERAAELAAEEATRVAADLRSAQALAQLCRVEEAQRLLEEVLPAAEQLGNLELLHRALALMATTCDELGQNRRCREYRERDLAAAEQIGDPALIAFSLSCLGGNLQALGHWEEARRYYERSVAIYRSLPSSSYYTTYPLGGLSGVAWQSGDLEAGGAYAEEALAVADRAGNLEGAWFATGNLVGIEVTAGQPEAACARLERFLTRPGMSDPDSPLLTDILAALAIAYVGAGDSERADETSAVAIRRARANCNRLPLSAGLRARGMALTRQERWEEAELCFEEALTLARALPMPREEAKALYGHGRMCVLQGRTEKGQERLREALTLFRQLGARLDAARTETAPTQVPPEGPAL